jgi:hypothetical protein
MVHFRVREPPKPPPHVFGLSSPSNMLSKLGWEIRQFKIRLATAPDDFWGSGDLCYMAFNAAVTAYHYGDWAWRALGEDSRNHVAEKHKFEQSRNARTDLTRFIDAMRSRRSISAHRLRTGPSIWGQRANPVPHSTPRQFGIFEPTRILEKYTPIWLSKTAMTKFHSNRFWTMLLFWEKLYRELGFIEIRFIEAD